MIGSPDRGADARAADAGSDRAGGLGIVVDPG